MKAILIPVEDHAAMEAVLTTALRLAERFGSYMEGVALGPDLAQISGADFSLGGVVFDERTQRELLTEAYEIFSTFMQSHGVAREQTEANQPYFGWRGDSLVTDEGVGEYGRIFDVIADRPAGGGHSAAAQIDARMGAFRIRPAAADRAAAAAGEARRMYRDRLEREPRVGAQRRFRHAAASRRARRAGDDGAGHKAAGSRRK